MLILALVLFLCCFGGSIGNPFGDDNDDDGNPIVDFLGRFGRKGAAVPDSAISAPTCRTGPNKFQISGSCTLNVAAGGTGLRNLVLTSTKGMNVTSPVPGKDFTVSDHIDAGKEVTVAIDEQGGAVTLVCDPSQTCVVTRGDGS